MGCCQSRRARDDQPSRAPRSSIATYTNDGEHAARRNEDEELDRDRIVPVTTAQPSREASNTPRLINALRTPRRRARTRSDNTTDNTANSLDTHCNRPLKPYVWKRRDSKRKWTRAEIDREREEFFETRVTGRQEIWAALKMVAEELRNGDIETAQGILDAAGITSPHGDLVEGCYDATGVAYKLEPVIVTDPPVIEESGEHNDGTSSITVDDSEGEGEGIIGKEIDEIGTASEGKGKAIQTPSVLVNLRLSDSDRNMTVRIGKDQHVHALEKRLRAEAKIPPDARIRMVHQGKLLNMHKTLDEQGWIAKNVVMVYITRLS